MTESNDETVVPTATLDDSVSPDSILAELEGARATFHQLVQSADQAALDRKSNGTRWTNRQLLFHMMFGYLIVRALLILIRPMSAMPHWWNRAFARFLDALTKPFNIVNYVGACFGSLVYRDRRCGRVRL
jgi:hypothetical protein